MGNGEDETEVEGIEDWFVQQEAKVSILKHEDIESVIKIISKHKNCQIRQQKLGQSVERLSSKGALGVTGSRMEGAFTR